jgi:two-component system, cell cycle sensor histidine kinase and response regulator CckA
MSQWVSTCERVAARPAPGEPVTPGVTQGARILAVDDSPDEGYLLTRLLGRRNCEVVTVTSGREAIDAWPRGGEPFDLVILDVNMPGMGGPEVFQRLRELHPGCPILFVTGSPPSAWRHGPGVEAAPYLMKPFSGESLTRMISSSLAGAS